MDALQAGGAMGFVVLGLAVLGLLVTLLLGVLGFLKRRVPLVLWVLIPALIAGAGAIGAVLTLLGLPSEMLAGDLATAHVVGFTGLRASLAPDWLGRWGAAIVLLAGTWVAAIPAVVTVGPFRRWTIGSALAAILLTLFGVPLLAIAAWYYDAGLQGVAMIGMYLVGGLGVGVAAMRRSLEEHASRIAGMRFASGMCFILAIAYAGKGMGVSEASAWYEAGIAGMAEARPILDGVLGYQTFSWMVFALAFLVGAAGFASELGDVVNRFLFFDVIGTIIVLGTLGGVRLGQEFLADSAEALIVREPIVKALSDRGADRLPLAQMRVADLIRDVPFEGGMFYDVVKKGDPKWNLRYRWTGGGWEFEGNPLETHPVQPGRTLVIAEASEPMSSIEAAFGMVRASGGDPKLLIAPTEQDEMLPRVLQTQQAQLWSYETTTDQTFASGFWIELAGFTPYQAALPVKVSTTERDPVARIHEIVKASGHQGDVVFVAGDKGSVRDFLVGCLGVMYEPLSSADQTRPAPTGRRCLLYSTPNGAADVRALARSVAQPPDVDGIKPWVKTYGIDRDLTMALIRWDGEKFKRCGERAKAAGEDTTGNFLLNVTLTPEHEITKPEWRGNPKRTIRGEKLQTCVMETLEGLEWPELESDAVIEFTMVYAI